MIIALEFLFLKEDDSGAFGNFNSDSVHALGLTDELHDFKVEVYIKFVVFFVTDDQSSL